MVESILSVTSVSAKPTLAAVARASNVSLATASYAMRGDPKIPAATRQRICAVAKEMGYTPNPELGRLMFLLRERHPPQMKAALAVLSLKGRSVAPGDFGRGLLRGMRERAALLGFALDVLEIDPMQMGKARVTQILLSRGVRGIVLASLAEAVDCDGLLDWEQFSSVSTTCLLRSPNLARVVPHHFQIAELALRKIWETGHRRVAWLAGRDDGAIEGAVHLAAHSLAQGGAELALTPLCARARPEALVAELRANRADAILVADSGIAEEAAEACRSGREVRRPIFVLDRTSNSRWPGVHQNPAAIGNLAIETLARLLQAGERGPSSCSTVTMIEGAWMAAGENYLGADEPRERPVTSVRAS